MVSICLLALHAGEASYVSSSSISAFRAAVVRAVWSSKMPLAHTPAVLNLLDGPVGVDPALHVVWVRFRMMRRYLAYCPEEVPRIFRMLDLISWRAPGRCPVHLLLISAAELGFAWDGDERGWLRPSLPLLRTMTGPIQHFFSSILDAWRYRVFAKLSERKGFLGAEYADFKGSLQLLSSSHLKERDKMLLRAILCGGVWNGFLLGRAKKEDVPYQFCGKRDGDGHSFWECSFPPSLHVRELPEFSYLMCLLWHGWLPGLSCNGERILGLLDLVNWPAWSLNVACVLIPWTVLNTGLRLIIGMLMILLWRCRIVLIFGQMVAGRISLLFVGLRLLALVFICLLLMLLLILPFGELQKSMVMLVWSVAVLFCRFLESCGLFSVLNSGVLLLPCRRTGLVIEVLTTNMLPGQSVGY